MMEGQRNLKRIDGWFSNTDIAGQLALAELLMKDDSALVDFLSKASPKDREAYLEIQKRALHNLTGGINPSHGKG
ncbi:hypothetical protein SARC_15285, partial [Sphaeroforma arctica JP610]